MTAIFNEKKIKMVLLMMKSSTKTKEKEQQKEFFFYHSEPTLKCDISDRFLNRKNLYLVCI